MSPVVARKLPRVFLHGYPKIQSVLCQGLSCGFPDNNNGDIDRHECDDNDSDDDSDECDDRYVTHLYTS